MFPLFFIDWKCNSSLHIVKALFVERSLSYRKSSITGCLKKRTSDSPKISNMYALTVSKLNGTYTLKQSDMDLVSWFADFIRIFVLILHYEWGVSGFNSAMDVNAQNHDHLVKAWTALEKLNISRNFLELSCGRRCETSHFWTERILVLVAINL